MADTGWIYAGSGRNIDIGSANWSSPGNITGAADGNGATVSLATGSDLNNELNAYNYTMGVPAGKQIDGIYVAICKYGDVNAIKDYQIYLMNDTAHKGNNKADTGTYWQNSYTWTYCGGAADLWGTSWTATQVNASTFGLIVRAKNHSANTRSAFVDAVGIKIYYSDQLPDHSMMMGM